jgi:hypothetical protein
LAIVARRKRRISSSVLPLNILPQISSICPCVCLLISPNHDFRPVATGKANGSKERERQVSAAVADIEQETNRAREELRGQVSAVALAGAEKILKREIDAKSHQDILGTLAQEL